MARDKPTRLSITLDVEDAAKLGRLAARTHTEEGALAQYLLSHALDDADSDPRHAADLLDGIPGAHERALVSHEQARANKTVPLDDL